MNRALSTTDAVVLSVGAVVFVSLKIVEVVLDKVWPMH